jgi:hypothetical protein
MQLPHHNMTEYSSRNSKLGTTLASRLLAFALLLGAGLAQASTVAYQKVELFKGETFFTETFEIVEAGSYLATLTDFEFPTPLEETGMSITTATEMLGNLVAPGSFTFEATPGEYFLSFFGFADTTSPTMLGQYGIEVSMTEMPEIPVPAAVWLFGSGLIGLVGVARRK